MKKKLRTYLMVTLLIGLFCTVLLGYFSQLRMLQLDSDKTSHRLFWQIQQILEENQVDAEAIRKDFSEICLIRTRAAAYILQHSELDIHDTQELKRIAELLQVDELHLFDPNGTIVGGSEPKYFGMNFNDGEQMRFFLPMLKDRTLSLCQEVTPNTAESKLMQYSAVWREDGAGIVQIGMEPIRLMQALEKTDLSYIFSLLTEADGSVLCVADPDTYEILGATNKADVGRSLLDLGLPRAQVDARACGFYAKIDGVLNYCHLTDVGGLMVGRFCDAQVLFSPANQNILLLALCMLLIAGLMLYSMFWYLNKYILQSIFEVNDKLQKITDGSFQEKVAVHTSPEFTQLSENINQMVHSLLENSAKLSFVLNSIQLPVGVYEYSHSSDRVRYTYKVPEILQLSRFEAKELSRHYQLFEEKMETLKQNPIGGSVYRLPGDTERYVKLDAYTSEDSFFGVLIDVTADIMEKQQIERERDEDPLTGLYNRRSFCSRAEALFRQSEQMGHAALLMIDTDDLKRVNDQCGHEAGDQYLRGMADILQGCTAPKRLAARLGGDEFALLIYGCASEEELRRYVAELADRQSEYIPELGSAPVDVRFSMGVGLYPTDSTDFSILLTLADHHMYEDKHSRKHLSPQ